MTEREDTIERIERVLNLTHKDSITVTIPRLTAERAVSMLKEQEAVVHPEPQQPLWKMKCMNKKVDMVEVVRCEYCKHRPTPPKAFGAEINGRWCYWCEHLKSWKPDNWFCADGERES